ncbi:ORF1 [torque teno Delphinidae virus 5]
MPYGIYSRRARLRRRYGRLRSWWGRNYGRRRRNWWRRSYYKRRLAWVRRKLRFLKRRRRRLWRRRRFKARKRRRLIGPVAIREYVPPVKRRCIIKGFFPLMYFNKNQFYLPFYDLHSQTFMGGGLTMVDFSLNMLYDLYTTGQCHWSKSNFGFTFGRFLGGSIKLFRHNYFSYFFKYWQGYKIQKELTWMDLHPADLVLQNEKVTMSANLRIPIYKRHKTKKVKIRRPPDMTTEFYDMCDLGSQIFLRIGASIVDFDQPFQKTYDPSGNYYVSLGYDTPDRRTLTGYKGITRTNSNLYVKEEILIWGKLWITWGGPINTWLPPGETTWWCGTQFGELCNETTANFQHDYKGFPDVCYSSGQNTPAYLIRWYNPTATHEWIGGKRMAFFCTGKDPPAWLSTITCPMEPRWDGFTTDLAQGNKQTQPQCSRSSHRNKIGNFQCDLDLMDRVGSLTQGFWPGRYAWSYDNGSFNVVYGLYLPSSGFQSSTYIKMSSGDTGPGTGSYKNFAVLEMFQGIPYYKVFYGHTYSSFLAYINALHPEIVSDSMGHQGFFAVAINTWPAYKVASGPFARGYAPLRYGGKNRQYFVEERKQKEPWPKWWQAGYNMPPIKTDGTIDYNAFIFCILRDGRHVMYGSSLEGSLLVRQRDYYGSARTYDTMDDIATLGKSGPFIPDFFPPDVKEKVINIPLKFKFYFQWAGYHQPGHFRKPTDPRGTCNKPNPSGYSEEQPSPSTRHRRKRHVTTFDDAAPVHPGEVWAQSFRWDRDLSPGGSIIPPVYERLTQYHLSTALGGLPDRQKSGRRTVAPLCAAYGAIARNRELQTSESETPSPDSEEEQSHLLPKKRRRALQEEDPGPHSAGRERSTETGPQYCLPCEKRWRPQSTRQLLKQQRHRQRLEHLQSQQRELQRLESRLLFKAGLKRSSSCSDLSCHRYQHL